MAKRQRYSVRVEKDWTYPFIPWTARAWPLGLKLGDPIGEPGYYDSVTAVLGFTREQAKKRLLNKLDREQRKKNATLRFKVSTDGSDREFE